MEPASEGNFGNYPMRIERWASLTDPKFEHACEEIRDLVSVSNFAVGWSSTKCPSTAISKRGGTGVEDNFVKTRLRRRDLSDDGVRVQVRRIRNDDAARLKRVRLASLAESPSAFGSTHAAEASRPDVEWVKRATSGSKGSDRATFFAQLDDEVVGLVGGYRDEPSLAAVHLVSMWVAPDARNRGAGASLVDAGDRMGDSDRRYECLALGDVRKHRRRGAL